MATTHLKNERLAFRVDPNPVETWRAIGSAEPTIRADDAGDRLGWYRAYGGAPIIGPA